LSKKNRIPDNTNINLERKLIPIGVIPDVTIGAVFTYVKTEIELRKTFSTYSKKFSKKHLFSKMEVFQKTIFFQRWKFFLPLIDDTWKTIFSKKVS